MWGRANKRKAEARAGSGPSSSVEEHEVLSGVHLDWGLAGALSVNREGRCGGGQ